MNVLVTGGTGFIGSHTVVELLEQNHQVYIIDNLSNSRKEVLTSIKQISGKAPHFSQFDLCDEQLCDDFFAAHSIEAIIHFAALKAVGESVEKPLLYYRNNLQSLLNLLHMCKKYGVKHFVFSSSCTVYGEPDALPISEQAPVKQPESPYGNTKKISEDILRDVARVNALNIISLRYFNPVGAHPTALIGEYPIGKPNNLMPVITQCAIGKLPGFSVFGNDYPTRDGSCIRDYIHVVDLAKAHVVAINRMEHGKNKALFEVFNIGTGTGISVLEMVNAFEKITGVSLNYKIDQRRPGDVVQVFADTALANNELGWKAQLGLDDMIASAWAWEQHLHNQK